MLNNDEFKPYKFDDNLEGTNIEKLEEAVRNEHSQSNTDEPYKFDINLEGIDLREALISSKNFEKLQEAVRNTHSQSNDDDFKKTR